MSSRAAQAMLTALVAAGLLFSGSARATAPAPNADESPAQPSTQPSSTASSLDPREQARPLLKAGLEHLAKVEHPEALALFQRAYALYPSPKLLINIGTTLRYLGQNAAAARAYERYLGQQERDPKRVTELKRILAELDLVTGWLEIRITSARAALRLDGRPIERAGTRTKVRVDPGQHTLVAQLPGQSAAVQVIDVVAQGLVRVALVPPERADAAPEIIVIENEAPVLPIVGYAMIAAGGAAAILGTTFGLLAQQSNEEAIGHCDGAKPSICDAAGSALGETATTRATISTVSFALAGALVAGGAVAVLSSPASEEDDAPVTARLAFDARPGMSLRLSW